ncbi:Serine/arginine-rich splicing factor SR45a [Zea mays]|uniref:Serine/arginine-rich splicing factor SR45a n=1 Tax=Zea mays TaxID=4577 RepID=A0A1D6MGM3_MAIZE|nr:Serine/arginine-rich splicing factor SR45a [Zea mays]
MPRPAAHACAVGVPQHPHRVACLQSRPHPLLLAQRDHQRLDVHRPARVHAVLRPHPGAPRPVLHQGVWYDWAPLLPAPATELQPGTSSASAQDARPPAPLSSAPSPSVLFLAAKAQPLRQATYSMECPAACRIYAAPARRHKLRTVIRASHKHALNFSLSQPYRFLGVYGFPRQSGGITSRGLVCWRKMASC